MTQGLLSYKRVTHPLLSSQTSTFSHRFQSAQYTTMSNSAFSQTLQYITRIKLVELERQRSACRQYVQDTLDAANLAPNALERVSVLLKAIRKWNGQTSI